jgi:hypothetical protein
MNGGRLSSGPPFILRECRRTPRPISATASALLPIINRQRNEPRTARSRSFPETLELVGSQFPRTGPFRAVHFGGVNSGDNQRHLLEVINFIQMPKLGSAKAPFIPGATPIPPMTAPGADPGRGVYFKIMYALRAPRSGALFVSNWQPWYWPVSFLHV